MNYEIPRLSLILGLNLLHLELTLVVLEQARRQTQDHQQSLKGVNAFVCTNLCNLCLCTYLLVVVVFRCDSQSVGTLS